MRHEDHRTPTVAVNLGYHVGSRDEAPGHNGFAHLFEHLMFRGSRHVPVDTRSARVFVVDRPGAAQSAVSVAQIGVARTSPDFAPVIVMTILGECSRRASTSIFARRPGAAGGDRGWQG